MPALPEASVGGGVVIVIPDAADTQSEEKLIMAKLLSVVIILSRGSRSAGKSGYSSSAFSSDPETRERDERRFEDAVGLVLSAEPRPLPREPRRLRVFAVPTPAQAIPG